MFYSKEEEARIQEILGFAHRYYQEQLIATVDKCGSKMMYKLEFLYDEVEDPPIISRRTFYVAERVFDAVLSHFSDKPFDFVSTKYIDLDYDTKKTDTVQ